MFVGLPGHSTTRPSPTPTTSGYQWTRNMPLQAVSPATHPLFLNSLTHKQLQPKVSKQAARKAVATQTQCKPMSIVQTFSASHGPLPCPQKTHLPPDQAPSAASKGFRSSSSPVSHTVTMQTNGWAYQPIQLSKQCLPPNKTPLPCASKHLYQSGTIAATLCSLVSHTKAMQPNESTSQFRIA